MRKPVLVQPGQKPLTGFLTSRLKLLITWIVLENEPEHDKTCPPPYNIHVNHAMQSQEVAQDLKF